MDWNSIFRNPEGFVLRMTLLALLIIGAAKVISIELGSLF